MLDDKGEAFTVGFDAAGNPETRTVREMTADEVVAAVNLYTAQARDDADAPDRLERLLRLVAKRPAAPEPDLDPDSDIESDP